MKISEFSITERVRHQTNEEWLAEYDNASGLRNSKPTLKSNIKEALPKNSRTMFSESTKETGIISVRRVGDDLLITCNSRITKELDSRIKQDIPKLAKLADSDPGTPLYQYVSYRTFIRKTSYLAVVFKDIRTGALAERYFNIQLRNKENKYFKTGHNAEFRVVGNTKRLQEGMFLKFWLDAVKEIPNDRLAQIYRYMNSWLSGVVVSCSSTTPHHDFTKLNKLKFEGKLYEII